MIRDAEEGDGEALAAIYNHYVTSTVVTFEEDPVSGKEMVQRLRDVRARDLPYLVLCEDGVVVGYAYAGPWKARTAYRFTVETSVYLRADCTGRGLGKPLYRALLDACDRRGLHCLIGGIALPNDASVRLHESLGFRRTGGFTEVGWKQDRWIDVGYWQRTPS
jgi:phosphinothricin acetyltransferase